MRVLKPEEIECRLQSFSDKTATFLLYKDVRTDVRVLSETYGDMWKNEYSEINGNIYCTISIWNDQLKAWISRSNVGTESNIEHEKGQASDAMKRAGFMWGIGTELYTAPQIRVDLTDKDIWNGKCTLKLSVKEVEITDDHKIRKLVLVDVWGNIRFSWSLRNEQTSTIASMPSESHELIPTQPCNGRDAILHALNEAVNNERQKPDANQYQLKRLLDYYTEKITQYGWDGKFDFDQLYSKWLSKSYK